MEDYYAINRKRGTVRFRTLSMKGQPYGEVDPDFIRIFYNELDHFWTLIDIKGNSHKVTFNMSNTKPRMMDGWSELRPIYGLTGDHSISLCYIGESSFLITVFKKPSPPSSFPAYHSQNPAKQARTFKVNLTHYKASGSQLNLPLDFAEYLKKSGFGSLNLRGLNGIERNCDLLIRNVPRRSIKIGKGWKHFSARQGFKMGDQVVFEFVYENANIVDVYKTAV